MADPHAVLGVSQGASKEEIKKAYRKLCMSHHPDRHAMSPEHVQRSAASAFKAVSEAYELLMDDARRHTHTRAGGFRGGPTAESSRAYSGAYGGYAGYSGGSSYSGYSQYRKRQRFSFGSVFRSLTSVSRQEVLLAAGVGALVLGGAALLEPLLASLWGRQNEGKLFSDIEQEVLRGQQEELERLRAARMARAAAAAAPSLFASAGPEAAASAPAAVPASAAAVDAAGCPAEEVAAAAAGPIRGAALAAGGTSIGLAAAAGATPAGQG